VPVKLPPATNVSPVTNSVPLVGSRPPQGKLIHALSNDGQIVSHGERATFPSTELKPGEKYSQTTIYKFLPM